MFRKLFFTIFICGSLFSACSEKGDSLHASWEEEKEGQALLTLSLMMPEGTGTRSQTDAQGGTGQTEVAQDTECKVSNAWVFLGAIYDGQQDPLRISHRYFIDRFNYAGNPAHWSATIPCPPGKYRMAVVVNPGYSNLKDKAPENWDELSQGVMTYTSYAQLETIWKKDHFLMTNAYQGKRDGNDVVLEAGRHTYKDLYVQRVCARFDYEVEKENNTYTVECWVNGTAQELTVRLTEARLLNLSKSFNLFKKVVPDVQPGSEPNFYEYEKADNFVYDADWEAKWQLQLPGSQTEELEKIFFFPSERKKADPTVAYQPLQTSKGNSHILTYASENTLPGVWAQINQLSTGMAFRGYFTLPPSLSTPPKTVYYRELTDRKELYTSEEELKKALQNEGVLWPLDGATDKALALLGIRKFTAHPETGTFPVYYTYWNRHNDNNDHQVMGIMEFAVVRNNVYKLRVNTIQSLGLPLPPDDPTNPWNPDGHTPDEELPQLDVTVKVCDWVTRKLEHEI